MTAARNAYDAVRGVLLIGATPTLPDAITPVVANHVLAAFGEHGAYSGGGFTDTLMEAFSRADMDHIDRLAAGFPEYACAYLIWNRTKGGRAALRARAGLT